jgi:two-component system response regulator
LKKSGVPSDVMVVRDGADALDFIFATGRHEGRDPTRTPALVLLDLQLPKLGGLEVLRRLRADARSRLLPVVVLTSSREEEDIHRSYSLGANGYVRKSISFDEFAQTAKTLGHFWILVNETAPILS